MNCFMIRKLKVSVVYIHVPNDGPHLGWAKRFTSSIVAHPGGYEHDTYVVMQNSNLPGYTNRLFGQLPNVKHFRHTDEGWDIGAYLSLSKTLKCDIMMCFGGHGYVRKAGWLARIVDAWMKYGPGFYGTLATYEVRPHFSTSGFAIAPSLLAEYPHKIVTKADRYEFEHGERSLVRSCILRKIPTILVTWDGEYEWRDWRKPPNVYVRGDQSNCLTYFRHSDSFEASTPTEKIRRSALADTLNPNENRVLVS